MPFRHVPSRTGGTARSGKTEIFEWTAPTAAELVGGSDSQGPIPGELD